MANMQRALNSKRSIAEITLTRMCDTRLSSDNEALLLRVEELEKAVKMLKLGVPVATPKVEVVQQETKKVEEKPKQSNVNIAKPESKSEKALSLYGHWGAVLKKIAELKRSLSSGFAGASVYTDGVKYIFKMRGFFADKLAREETDLAIVRGVIAEHEGKNPNEITIVIENMDKVSSSPSEDLDDLFK